MLIRLFTGCPSAEEAEAKRRAAAEGKRDAAPHWRPRLGLLAQDLLSRGHPAALEVVSQWQSPGTACFAV